MLTRAAAARLPGGKEGVSMNWDIVKGKWTELKGEARKRWGKLTDNDWEEAAGEKDKLLGKLQQRYGWTKEQAEQEAERYFSERE
jgi:uncharacterized protein YjbJ (UPF0337 family)